MVIADNLALYVYGNSADVSAQNGATLFLVAVLGVIHFYCDFAGYSDIAIGTARILGFDLMKNFDYPLFARSIAEFWQKWHISLITWFRDYLVSWLKGFTKPKLFRNILIVFFVTGLWHGASLTYIIWGLLNALLFVPTIFSKRRRKFRGPVAAGKVLPTIRETYQMATTYVSFMLVGVFFIHRDLGDAVLMLRKMFSTSLFSIPKVPIIETAFVFIFFAVEWHQRNKNHGLELLPGEAVPVVRWGAYLLLIFSILIWGGESTEFVYFQF